MRSRSWFGRRARFTTALSLTLLLALSTTIAAFANVTLTQLNTDPYTNSTSQHKTEVEPDSFSFGSTIVAATQVGRFNDGGASNIGWATSTNGGSTWTNGQLPGLTVFSSPAGQYARATDPAVAYDAAHNVWLINSLGLTQSGSAVIGTAVVVNRSTDGGLTWGNAVTVRAVTGNQNFDKNWIVCDTTSTSPFYGRCYVEYDDNGNGNALHMAFSTDGGQNWTESTVPNVSIIGGQPVVQPNGTVIVPIDNGNETALGSTVSTNGGASYSAITTITGITDHTVAGNLRSGPLPSAEVDGSGKVYVVWQDCRFRRGCKSNDIVMTTSTNGTTWTSVVRVPIGATGDKQDNFIPGIAVDKSTSGSTAHIAITFYYYPTTACGGNHRPACQLDVGYISSTTGGVSWGPFTQLAGPMTLSWLPNTTQGRMVGDYISSSFNNSGLAHGLFAVANAPTAGGADCATATPNCDQALYTNAAGLSQLSGVVVTSSGDHPVPNAASDHAAPRSPITVR
jgi:hypothetical protein